jgi:hypothetical protein
MTEPEPQKSSSLGAAGWIAIVVMVGFLIVSVWYAAWAWGQMEGVEMSTAGWVFLILGIVVTFLVGAGLMGLVFYSSRKNFDR